MISTDNILVFASILFLVVVELSREASNEALNGPDRPKDSTDIPINKFTIIHILNTLLLLILLVVCLYSLMSSYDVLVILIFVLDILLLLVLPYLEVKSYDIIRNKDERWNSYSYHIRDSIIMLAFTVMLVALDGFEPLINIPSYSLVAKILFSTSVIGLFYIAVWIGCFSFLLEVEEEIKQNRLNRNSRSPSFH